MHLLKADALPGYLMKTDHQMSVLPVLIRDRRFQALSNQFQQSVPAAAAVVAQAGTERMFDLTDSPQADLDERA